MNGFWGRKRRRMETAQRNAQGRWELELDDLDSFWQDLGLEF